VSVAANRPWAGFQPAVGGEILSVGLYGLRMAGVFDLALAAGVLGQVMATCTKFWIFCKLALLGSIGLFCVLSASERKIVKLDV
jgi:hypothetical protein